MRKAPTSTGRRIGAVGLALLGAMLLSSCDPEIPAPAYPSPSDPPIEETSLWRFFQDEEEEEEWEDEEWSDEDWDPSAWEVDGEGAAAADAGAPVEDPGSARP